VSVLTAGLKKNGWKRREKKQKAVDEAAKKYSLLLIPKHSLSTAAMKLQ